MDGRRNGRRFRLLLLVVATVLVALVVRPFVGALFTAGKVASHTAFAQATGGMSRHSLVAQLRLTERMQDRCSLHRTVSSFGLRPKFARHHIPISREDRR